MKIVRGLWLCSDCCVAAVNDDYSGLDYYLSEAAATRRMDLIQRELAKLPGLVPDFSDGLQYECLDCGFTHDAIHFKWEDPIGDGDYVRACGECSSLEVRERESGEEEFSHRDCDCCGDDLAGSRFRFAQLIEEDQHENQV